MKPQAWSLEEETDKLDFITVKKNFSSFEDTGKQDPDWEKIFVIHIPDKGLVSKKYEDLSTQTYKRQSSKK